MKPVFNEERRGYSREEVDQYIELLRGEYVKLTDKYNALGERMQEYDATNDNMLGAMASVNAYVNHVKQETEATAEKIIADSRQKAAEITYEAQTRAEKMYSEARQKAIEMTREAEAMAGKAQAVADKIVSDGRQKAAEMAREVEARAEKMIADSRLKAAEITYEAEQMILDSRVKAESLVTRAQRDAFEIHRRSAEMRGNVKKQCNDLLAIIGEGDAFQEPEDKFKAPMPIMRFKAAGKD